ncbi:hypothetical protein OH492_10005 [Vibrio chagasii]|nr:hypothetical protein [Vibrio chagasii]
MTIGETSNSPLIEATGAPIQPLALFAINKELTDVSIDLVGVKLAA